MTTKLQVFVSSTFQDLGEKYRDILSYPRFHGHRVKAHVRLQTARG